MKYLFFSINILSYLEDNKDKKDDFSTETMIFLSSFTKNTDMFDCWYNFLHKKPISVWFPKT